MIKNKYKIEQVAESRWFYKFIEKNSKCEALTIELTKCIDNDMKNSLPKLWYKKGYTDKYLDTYWCINTYVKDSEGNSYGRYNPTIKAGHTIDFDWTLEATEENKEILLNEVYNRFITATGETATEIKNKKIYDFASVNKVEIYNNIPSDWVILKGAVTAPAGTVWISNNKSLKSRERKTAILITK